MFETREITSNQSQGDRREEGANYVVARHRLAEVALC